MKTSCLKLSAWHIIMLMSGFFLTAAPASADLAWNWEYKCSALTTQTRCQGGSGTFTTTEQQGSGTNEYYVVTGMTGTVEGNTITSLLAPNSLGEANDNKIDNFGTPFPNAGSKITGIAFLTNNDAPSSANLNLLFSNFIDDFVGYYTQIGGPNNLSLLNIDFSGKRVGATGEIVTVAEPNTLLVFSMSVLMLGIVAGRKLSSKKA